MALLGKIRIVLLVVVINLWINPTPVQSQEAPSSTLQPTTKEIQVEAVDVKLETKSPTQQTPSIILTTLANSKVVDDDKVSDPSPPKSPNEIKPEENTEETVVEEGAAAEEVPAALPEDTQTEPIVTEDEEKGSNTETAYATGVAAQTQANKANGEENKAAPLGVVGAEAVQSGNASEPTNSPNPEPETEVIESADGTQAVTEEEATAEEEPSPEPPGTKPQEAPGNSVSTTAPTKDDVVVDAQLKPEDGTEQNASATTVKQDSGVILPASTTPVPNIPPVVATIGTTEGTTIPTPAPVTSEPTTKAPIPVVTEKPVPTIVKEVTDTIITSPGTKIEVDVGQGSDVTPPIYVLVTSVTVPTSTTPQNDSLVAGPDTGATSTTFFTPKMIGILVGAAVGLVLIIGLVVVTIVTLKRRKHQKKERFAIVENPRYLNEKAATTHNYRFSGDASLLIGGPTLNQSALANNNINDKNDLNSDRKKRRAPPPPNPFTGEHDTFPLRQDSNDYYQKLSNNKKKKAPHPPNPFSGEVDGLSNPNAIQYFEQLLKKKKRRAPPPPNPFTGEVDDPIYKPISEPKDSPSGSEIELSTFTAGFKKDRPTNVTNDNDKPEADRLTPQASHSGPEAEEGEELRDPDPESQALLSDIERETGYKLTVDPTHPPPKPARQSVADKYEFSDDEEARESRDYYRQESFDNFSSDDDLDESKELVYDVSDIQDELQKSAGEYDKSKNPFES